MKALVTSVILVLLVVTATLGLVGHLAFSAPPEPRAPEVVREVASLPAMAARPASTATLPMKLARPSPTVASLPMVTSTPTPAAPLEEQEEQFEAWSAPASLPTATPLPRDGCDPAYPDGRTCIPPGPPFDQGCAITAERLFTVLPPDPQRLDHDDDGIGCEPI